MKIKGKKLTFLEVNIWRSSPRESEFVAAESRLKTKPNKRQRIIRILQNVDESEHNN